MLDGILITLIFLLILSSFLIVKIWKKTNFVKEVYFSSDVSIIIYIISLANTIALTTLYFVLTKESLYSWLYWLMLLGVDLWMMLTYSFTATYCIYLKGDTLIRKSIFSTKRIKINKETVIFRKFDKIMIKSTEGTITIDIRGLDGSINSLVNKIEEKAAL